MTFLKQIDGRWQGRGNASPRDFFQSAEPGVYFDFSAPAGLYQDHTGTTPLAAPDQWMKLAVDRSRNRSPITVAAALQANTGLSPKWGRAPKVKRNLLTLGGTAMLTNGDGTSLLDNAPTGFTPPVDAAFQRVTKNTSGVQFYAYRVSQPGSATDPSVFSWYMLPDAGCTLIGMQTSGAAQGYFRYNLSTGIVTKGANTADAGAIPIGGGWYRCWTKTAAVTGSTTWSIIANTAAVGDAASFVVGGHQSEAAVLTALQKTLSAFDMTESGVPSYGFARCGLDDDVLSATLPAAQTGDVLVFGRNGSWIETGVTYGAGSTWSIGVTTVTGLPQGLLYAIGDIVGIVAIGRTLTATERNMALAYHKARGAAGWLVAGADQAANGGLDTDTIWTKGAGWAIGSGVATKTAGTASALDQAMTFNAGVAYLVTFDAVVSAGIVSANFIGGTAVGTENITTSGAKRYILLAGAGNNTFRFSATSLFAGTIDNVSVKPLTVAA